MAAATAPSWLAEDTVDDLIKETSSGAYVNPSKLADGKDHRFRFFGAGITGFETWTTDNKPVRFRTKPDVADLPANVRTREDGIPEVRRFIAGVVYDYENEQFKILQLTQKGLMQALFGYMKDPDYGDACNYDFKLHRKGSGLNTEYTFKVSPPKAAASSIQAEFEDLTCDLDKLFDGKDPFETPKA